MNFSGYSSPTIDAALEKGRALSDPEARKEQYAIVQKELGDVVLFDIPDAEGIAKGIIAWHRK